VKIENEITNMLNNILAFKDKTDDEPLYVPDAYTEKKVPYKTNEVSC
jgi:hypothetical protein